MGEELDDFELLLKKVSQYMKEYLNYSDSYIDRYKYGWRRVKFYLSLIGQKAYKADFEEDLCKFIFKDKNIRNFTDNERLTYRSIKQLSEFVNTGKIIGKRHSLPKHFDFEGNIGEVIKNFCDIKMTSYKSPRTGFYCLVGLRAFYIFCKQKGIEKFNDIEVSLLLEFISQIHENKYGNIFIHIPLLRQLFRYAFEEKILDRDIAGKIPIIRSVKNVSLPSVYTTDEVTCLINSIDRDSKWGKRSYAIVLLAAIFGIRASDIANLKFENIDWEKSTISFIQMKTQKFNNLPLLPDVGNAIIDYLKYARPISDYANVFLTTKGPIIPIRNSVVSKVVHRAFVKAGIDVSGRKFGSHALRHSLASRLLDKKVNYPIISEILGHNNSNSTMVYLRIDLKSMEIFLTDVPMVSNDFYQQGGGVFYV